MNIVITCPICNGTQETVSVAGDHFFVVPECNNPACTAPLAWGPVDVSMIGAALATITAAHPTGTGIHIARFIVRLLKQVRPMAADATDQQAKDNFTARLNALARR